MRHLRLVWLLSIRPLGRHPLRAALAVLAIAAGTSLAVSVLVVRSSVQQSVDEFGQELAGPSELRVVGAMRRGGLEPDVVQHVASTEGVRAAVPLVQAVTLANGDDGSGVPDGGVPVLGLGVDCRIEAITGPFGCTEDLMADRRDRPLARGAGISEGAVLTTNRGDVALEGVPRFDGFERLSDGRFAVFPLATAQRLFERDGNHDVIYVQADPGHDLAALKAKLQEVVGPHNGVLDATQGPPEVSAALDDVLPLFTLLALFGLGTGTMLVYNTVTLAMEQRRRELAVMGALGGTPRLLAQVPLGEAGLLGLLGGLGGAVGGTIVAVPLVSSLALYTERVAGIPLDVRPGLAPVVVGATAGLLAASVASVPGVRRVRRIDVVSELGGRHLRHEASVPFLLRRIAVWTVLAMVGLGAVWLAQRSGGLAPWQHPTGGIGFGLAALGVLLLGGSVSPLLVRLLLRLQGGSAAVRLAFANLACTAGRTGVMVAAVSAAAATAFVTSGFSLGFSSAVTGGTLDRMDGVRVSTVGSGANINLDAGIAPEVLDELGRVDGVGTIHRGAAVLTGSRSGEIVMVTAYEEPWESRDGDRGIRGVLDLEAFERGEALISTTLARNTGLRPGDEISLPTPGGMVGVPVQAVVHGSGPGDGSVSVSYDTHVDLYGAQPVRSVYVEAAPGTSPHRLARNIEAAGLGMDLRVDLPVDVVADARQSVDRQMAPFWALQRGLLVVAFIAVLSTMLLVGAQRRREMAILAVAGAGPSTLARMVVVEAVVIAAAANLVAITGGVLLLWAMTKLSPLTVGFPVPFQPDWLSALLAGATVTLVCLLAALWPAARAFRTAPLESLRPE